MSVRLASRLQPLVRAPVGQAFINGTWRSFESGDAPYDIVNPTTEEVLCAVPSAPASIVNEAVAAARASFENGWNRSTGKQRAECLRRLATIVDDNAARLLELEVVNMGKSYMEAKGDLGSTSHCLRYYAGLAEEMDAPPAPPRSKLPDDNYDLEVREEAIGVAALIVPWNYPLLMATWKIAPALAAGCSIILKPSEYTPLSMLELADLSKDVFPPGVFNLVCGQGSITGSALINNAGIDKIAFTGSVPTGSSIMAAAAKCAFSCFIVILLSLF